MSQNSNEQEDLRVRRTRKLLQEALIALTVEKGFNAVTVRDITERAMVNRSTFYRHYLDKYDLLDQYMEDSGNLSVEEGSESERLNPAIENVPPGLVRLLNHVQRYGEFYRVMLGQNGDARFTNRFRKRTENRFRFLLSLQEPRDPAAPPIDLTVTYVACAGVGAILWWLENDQPFTTEQMAAYLSQLSYRAAGLDKPQG